MIRMQMRLRCIEYRQSLNISSGLIEACRHLLAGLYSRGLIFEGSFGLGGNLCMPKISPFAVQHLMRKTSQKNHITETPYIIFPCLLIILTIHTESQM